MEESLHRRIAEEINHILPRVEREAALGFRYFFVDSNRSCDEDAVQAIVAAVIAAFDSNLVSYAVDDASYTTYYADTEPRESLKVSYKFKRKQ